LAPNLLHLLRLATGELTSLCLRGRAAPCPWLAPEGDPRARAPAVVAGVTGERGRYPDSPETCGHIGCNQVEITGVGPGWSDALPTIPLALVWRMDVIAEDLTPLLRERLRELGVPNPDHYCVAFDSSPATAVLNEGD
jgi:hypothetical protein